jgi:hypothetical protein
LSAHGSLDDNTSICIDVCRVILALDEGCVQVPRTVIIMLLGRCPGSTVKATTEP